MSDITTSKHTVGGLGGHLFRRFIHVAMILIPIAYYYWANKLPQWLGMTPEDVLGVLLLIVIIVEFLRLRFGIVIFGHRKHETNHISSFAWGGIAMITVLLAVPDPIYAIPIVAGCALGDPIIGEMKRGLTWWGSAFMAALVICLIWLTCLRWMDLPYWFPYVAAVLTVAAERPNLTWIDDNALMQFVPLALLLITTAVLS